MIQLGRDAKFCLRLCVRQPAWAAAVVLSLSMGLAATALTFSIVDSVLLRPLPYVDDSRLYLLWGTKDVNVSRGLPPGFIETMRTGSHSFQAVGGFIGRYRLRLGTDSPDAVMGACIDSHVLPTLGVQPLMGRGFTAQDLGDGADVALLSHATWRGRFGADPTVVGKHVRLNGVQHEVVGVMPAGFFFPDADTHVWIPTPCGFRTEANRGEALLHAVARVKEGIRADGAQRDVDRLAALAGQQSAPSRAVSTGVFPFRSVVVRRFERAMWLLSAAVLVVLLIACLNVVYLQLARGLDRTTEFALRLSTGATSVRLVRQLATEALVLSSVAALFGVALAYAGLRIIRSLGLQDVQRLGEASMDARVLLLIVACVGFTTLVAGVWPAVGATRVDPAAVLRRASASIGGWRSRRPVLLAGQIAASVVLVVSSTLLIRSFVALAGASWGFDPQRLVVLRLKVPPELKGNLQGTNDWAEGIVAAVRGLGAVEAAATAQNAPLKWTSWKSAPVAVDGRIVSAESATSWVVGPGYFHAAGIQVLQGREFDAAHTRAGPPAVVISRALASQLGSAGTAIGKKLQLLELKTVNGEPLPEFLKRWNSGDRTAEQDPRFLQPVENKLWEVVGVVEDVRMFGLDRNPPPTLYLSHRQVPDSVQWRPVTATIERRILVRTKSAPSPSLPAIRDVVLSASRGTSITETALMEDDVQRSIGGRGTPKLMMLIVATFATLALLFCFIGVYGLTRFLVVRRMHEFGVRASVGATPRALALIVTRSLCWVVFGGVLAGIPIAWVVARSMRSAVFGVSALDPINFAVSVAMVSLGGVMAGALPIRRVFRVRPADLLRD